MDPSAFLTLAERCVPDADPKPLAAVVRQASGFEPLVIVVVQNGRPISILARSKDDAIAVAAEARVAGQRVRVGLAGVDTRDLDRLGLSLGDAFEPCANLRAAASRLEPNSRAVNGPSARAGSSSAGAQHGPPTIERVGSARPPGGDRIADERHSQAPRAWDVYGRARVSATLVYAPQE